MPGDPNKLSQFWQKLKRRRVPRILAIYAGSAYVVFEASTLIFPRWGLPDWTIDLVLYLLILGAIITFVVSWIYDLTPEGIQKTQPVNEAPEGEVAATPNGWKIASYISMVVIVVLVVLNIVSLSDKKAILDKSIAVLPFRNDSPEQTEMYFIDGTMESILDNLCKIEDLRVVSRTSVEQYRDNPKTIPEVADEMNVSYVIEGSGLKHDDNIRLTIQLIDGITDQHLWSQTYNRKTIEIFELQSEIAQLVAAEIEAFITPKEKQLIEKVPTTSITAHDYYLQGREAQWNYYTTSDSADLDQAEEQYKEAIKYDSTFAKAYIGLADVYWIKQFWKTYFYEDFLDSVLFLADVALSFDNELSEAYVVRGEYFNHIGEIDRAIEEFSRAIQFNPNNWSAYMFGGALYTQIDLVKSIQYYHKALALNRGDQLPEMLANVGWAYLQNGFIEKSKYYYTEAFKLTRDTLRYNDRRSMCEFVSGNFSDAIEYLKKAYALNSTNSNYYHAFGEYFAFGEYYMMNGDYVQSLKYFKKWLEKTNSLSEGALFGMHRVGWAYWKNGLKEEGELYLNKEIDICNRIIGIGRVLKYSYRTYYDLAATYAFKGEKDKAYENLRNFNKQPMFDLWMVTYIKNDPLLDNIRDEPEFQQIVRDIEAKYQAEHERVRKWLEENDML